MPVERKLMRLKKMLVRAYTQSKEKPINGLHRNGRK
jgi:hypothetical protein